MRVFSLEQRKGPLYAKLPVRMPHAEQVFRDLRSLKKMPLYLEFFLGGREAFHKIEEKCPFRYSVKVDDAIFFSYTILTITPHMQQWTYTAFH